MLGTSAIDGANPDPADSSRYEKTWLCPTPLDRARLLELDGHTASAGVCLLCVVAALLITGRWWALLPFPVFLFIVAVIPRVVRRLRHPEYVVFGAGLLMFAAIDAATAKTGGVDSPLFLFALTPSLAIATRFTDLRRVVAVGALSVSVFMCVFIIVDPRAIVDHPLSFLGFVATYVSLTTISSGLIKVEVQYRRDAVLDPLTGLLNRRSLDARFEELAQQASLTGSSICVIACDLDHFKTINDRLGHQAGDAVLIDVAYTMRKTLRQFELIYRTGGEEFLIVLPGIDDIHGAKQAERVRGRIALARPGGVDVTMSLGVASARGGDVILMHLMEHADAALYAAKKGGRNRVVTYAAPVAPPASSDATRPEPLAAGR